MNLIEWIKSGFKSEKRDDTIQPSKPWPRLKESTSDKGGIKDAPTTEPPKCAGRSNAEISKLIGWPDVAKSAQGYLKEITQGAKSKHEAKE